MMRIKDMPDEIKTKIKKFDCAKYRMNRCIFCPMKNKIVSCLVIAVSHYDEIANTDIDIEKLQAEGLIECTPSTK